MTKDLRNTYKDLFSYLRKELPSEKEKELLDMAENNPEIGEDLYSFGAAKVLLEENDLLDFKQAAKGYVKQQKAKKLKIKAATATVAVVASVFTYLHFNNESKSDDASLPTQIETNKDSSINDSEVKEAIEKQFHNNPESQNIEDIKSDSAKEKVSMESIKKEKIEKEAQPSTPGETQLQNLLEKPSKPDSTNKETVKPGEETTTPGAEKKTTKDPEKIEKPLAQESPKDKKKKETDRHIITADDQEEPFEEEVIIEDESKTAEVDPCDLKTADTFEPEREYDVVLIDYTEEDGNLVIFSEHMQEIYQQNFQAGNEIRWEGKDMRDNFVPTGYYKIIITFRNGRKCIKDITILRRY